VYPLGHKRRLTLAFKVEEEEGYKVLMIGHAIRRPDDELSELGERIATNRLHSSKGVQIYASMLYNAKYLPKSHVENQVDQVAEYVKNNLDIYAPGYND